MQKVLLDIHGSKKVMQRPSCLKNVSSDPSELLLTTCEHSFSLENTE